jgi:hypothetical protein
MRRELGTSRHRHVGSLFSFLFAKERNEASKYLNAAITAKNNKNLVLEQSYRHMIATSLRRCSHCKREETHVKVSDPYEGVFYVCTLCRHIGKDEKSQ